MIKYLLFACIAGLPFCNSFAQNIIPNPGFENWTTQGGYDEPNGWGTINQTVSQACFCKGTAVKSAAADAHNGSLAIKLITLNISLGVAPGITATGTINITTQKIDGGVPFNWRPQDITGWYKYTPHGTDSASVQIILSKWDTVTNARVQVGIATFTEPNAVSSYTQFSKPIQYSLPDNPDTMVITMLSSGQSPTTANANSTFWVDDLALTLASGISVPVDNFLFSVFPNPTSGALAFSGASGRVDLKIFDSAGKLVRQEQGNSAGTYTTSVGGFAPGIYFYEFLQADSTVPRRGKFAVERSY